MTTIYEPNVKVARMNAVTSQAGATAVLEIGTAGFATILASIPLNNPIAPTATGAGLLAMSGFPKTVNALATGTPVDARIRTATGGANIITGWKVGLAGSATGGVPNEVIVDSMSLTTGQPIQVQSASVTHAA